MRVKVTAMAFYAGSRVSPGQIISVPDTFDASWAEKVKLETKTSKKPDAPIKKASKKKAKKKTAKKK